LADSDIDWSDVDLMADVDVGLMADADVGLMADVDVGLMADVDNIAVVAADSTAAHYVAPDADAVDSVYKVFDVCQYLSHLLSYYQIPSQCLISASFHTSYRQVASNLTYQVAAYVTYQVAAYVPYQVAAYVTYQAAAYVTCQVASYVEVGEAYPGMCNVSSPSHDAGTPF